MARRIRNSPTVHLVPRPHRSQPQGPPLPTTTTPCLPLRTATVTPLLRCPPPRPAALITSPTRHSPTLLCPALFFRVHVARQRRGCSVPWWICSAQATTLVCSCCLLMRLLPRRPVLPGLLGPFLRRRTDSSQLLFGPRHKAAALRINLNIEGCGIVAPPLHAPSRDPLLLPLLLSHNLPLPRVH